MGYIGEEPEEYEVIPLDVPEGAPVEEPAETPAEEPVPV